MPDIVVTSGRSVDANPRGGNHHTTGMADTVNCSNRRGIAGVTITTTTTTCEQMSPTVAATMVITRYPLPKRQRIMGPNRKSCNKSSDDSAEGEDCQWAWDDNGRTRQRRRQSASSEGNRLPTATAMGSGKSGWGWTTKATDKNGGR
jgi:hypothetical protein